MTYPETHLAECRARREACREPRSIAIRAKRTMTDTQRADYRALLRVGLSVREAVAKVMGEGL